MIFLNDKAANEAAFFEVNGYLWRATVTGVRALRYSRQAQTWKRSLISTSQTTRLA